jgi:tetratricopeptide (TPR) repeat protein/transcriptional regulator with XRE-family HTH domain
MDDMTLSTFGELLKAFRKQHKITQQALARQLGVHRNTIGTWENGEFLPDSKAIVLEIARLLHLDTNNTRRLLEASLTALSPHWQMPYQRNPFFTGRDSVLQQLHDALAHEHTAVISQSYALSGLGGIGKTQTAIEYAYRYANDYAGVFWISAETNESIVSSFVAIAELLNLPEKQDKEQDRVITAVTRWLTSHSDWLLIFDNVENSELVKSVLPPARCGSLLFTSRRQALEFSAHILDLEQMTLEEGMRFLLHRARLLAPTASLDSLAPEDATLAQEIVTAMAGLPLALDQAGAYIEVNQLSLAEYLELFQSSQMRLLDEQASHSDHPSSVAKTFALAFEQLERNNPAAAELLTVCAFLAPEAIPETFFIDGAKHLGPTFEKLAADPFAFRTAIKALLTYSLIQRNAANRTITIHRLVQVVLKERLSGVAQRTWIICVTHALTQLFPPNSRQPDYWSTCERLVPHARTCITLSDQQREDIHEHATLMSYVATYLSQRARFSEADALFQQALHIKEQVSGPEHPQIAEVLYEQAYLYLLQSQYQQAEALFLRALHIREQTMGSEHLLVAEVLNRLAILYWHMGRYQQVEALYQRTLFIREQTLGPDHPQVASALNNLAVVYKEQGQYEKAIPLYERALHIGERTQGSEHIDIAYPLNNLAVVYFSQGQYEKAELLYQRALDIRIKVLGLDHPLIAMVLSNLGAVYMEQGQYEKAESFYERALHIREQALGSDHPEVAYPIQGLAALYKERGQYEKAKSFYERALHIREQALGFEHLEVAYPIQGLATLYKMQGQYEKAKPLYEHALTLLNHHLDQNHPDVADIFYELAHFHQLQQQTTEALSLYQHALTIREKALGPHHPKTNATRITYTDFLRELGRLDEAMTLENQVLETAIES